MSKNSNIEWTHHTSWGSEVLRKDGYILIRCPCYPGASNGYVLKHRLVMATHLGRVLKEDEHVHHLNGDKQDNRVENLQLVSNAEHRALHEAMLSPEEKRAKADHLILRSKSLAKPRRTISCECGCGGSIITPDKKGRERRFIQGHNQVGKNWSWPTRR